MELLKKWVALLAVFTLVLTLCPCVLAETTDTIDVEVTTEPQNAGKKVTLEWVNYSYSDKAFKVFRSADGTNFETVGVDFSENNKVKVLQIYPVEKQLQSWLVDSGYGRGCLEVTEVSFADFNTSPSTYLKKDGEGHWNYDVVYIGAWNGNDNKDFNSTSYELVRKYMLDGKGIVFGHDSIAAGTTPGQGYINRLAGEILPEIKYSTAKNNNWTLYTKVEICRNSVFTQYPNNIGPKGTILTVPDTHQFGQWIDEADQDKYAYIMGTGYTVPTGWPKDPYLFVKGNAAFIQTGNLNGASTADEQMVTANLCFFLNQVVYDTHSFTDPSAFDEAAPDKPKASAAPDGATMFESRDNGTEYTYYVESYTKGEMKTPVAASDRQQVRSTSGLKGFVYTYDNAANTEIKNDTGMEKLAADNSIDILANAGKKAYFHIAAIDGVGNVSETATVSIADVFKEKYSEILDKATADRNDRETIEEALEVLDSLGDDVKDELTEEKKTLEKLEEEAVFDDDVSTFIENHASKTNGKKIKKKSDINSKVAQKIVDGEQVWSDLTPDEQAEVDRRLAPLTYETLLKYAKAALVPDTGDSTNIALIAGLMLLALIGIILAGVRKRNKK